ncbi:MAG: phosphatidate cytidylyltransferase, partial [Alphaproteobacteria bacterium]
MDNSAILSAVGGIWALLVLASIIVFALIKLKPEKDYSELALRTKSWWVMIGIFTFAMLTSRVVSLCFLGLVSFLALKEFFSMIPTRRADRRVLFWAYLAIPIQYYWAAQEWYGMFIIFIPVYAFLFLPLRMIITQKTEGFLKAVGTIHWGLMTCVFSISHTAYLLVLPPLPVSTAGGAGLLLYLAFLTQFNDVSQYVWGKLFGKHKILPTVSPKKTWQGLIGGVFTTTIIAVLIAPYITPFDMLHAVCAGLLISIAGFIGDVT